MLRGSPSRPDAEPTTRRSRIMAGKPSRFVVGTTVMIHIALLEPEIPANTGNISRLCIGANCPLHLIGRTGFSLEDKYLRRAGLDYWPMLELYQHATMEEFREKLPGRMFYLSTHGSILYTTPRYQPGDILLFGSESCGLPKDLLAANAEHVLTIPRPGPVRSLNLSNAASIVLYEALRQIQGW